MNKYFEYGGYNFCGYRNFNPDEKKYGVWNGIDIRNKITPTNYTHEDFYKKIKGTEHYVDLFYCKEEKGVFVPINNCLAGFATRE